MKTIIVGLTVFVLLVGTGASVSAASGPFVTPGGSVSPNLRIAISRYGQAFYSTPVFRFPGGARRF